MLLAPLALLLYPISFYSDTFFTKNLRILVQASIIFHMLDTNIDHSMQTLCIYRCSQSITTLINA